MARFLLKCLKYFVFAGFFSLFINTLYLTFPIYMEAIYVRVLGSQSFSTLYTVTAGAVLALLVLGVLDFLRSRILVKAGIYMDELLGRRVLKDMLKESSTVESPGYNQGLMDINTLRNYFAGNAIFAFFDVPWIPIYLGVIYLMHPMLGMTAAGGAVVILALGLLQNVLTKNDLEQVHDFKGKERNFVIKCLRNSEMLKSMGMLQDVSGQWNKINDHEMVFQDKANKKGAVLNSISKSFRSFMQVLIYCMGALLVIKNEVTMGAIIAASIIMGRALAPVDQGIGAFKQTIGARASYKRLDRLLKDSKVGDLKMIDSLDGNLDVINAGLDIGEKTILKDITFTLKKGESMGLIGQNGAGKTSLCRMILGMWTPSSGDVFLDGQDSFSIDQDSLGPFIGYLPQDIELFTGTVSENIARMGEVDSKKVVEAAKMAGAHEVILRFLNGYETDIGEAGLSLSGGQRQRVAFARALYGNPALVILDEPNSNLDEAGEKSLVHALKQLKIMGTTVIMITHKPDLLSGVDKILVLSHPQDQGSVADFGNRDEVFERSLRGRS
ncbi:MAG: type I secretion system permease/ATPase [Thermodesulfobacteriota bacterium]|nr:type I secretion system permease/ATPase [Thermodesulfobacteriota bacterium]